MIVIEDIAVTQRCGIEQLEEDDDVRFQRNVYNTKWPSHPHSPLRIIPELLQTVASNDYIHVCVLKGMSYYEGV